MRDGRLRQCGRVDLKSQLGIESGRVIQLKRMMEIEMRRIMKDRDGGWHVGCWMLRVEKGRGRGLIRRVACAHDIR
jgi:hypothetical protein